MSEPGSAFTMSPGGIALPVEKPPEVPPGTPTPYHLAVRTAIARGLRVIEDELGAFEQTCHGVLPVDREWIGPVCRDLEQAYTNPTAFAISTLAQEIRLLLRDKETAHE